MRDHSQPMSVHNSSMKDGGSSPSVAAAGDSLDHISYEDGAGLSADHQIAYDETGIIVDGHSTVYIGSDSELAMPLGDVSNQLTLTFRGQVYVFDSVTPDKVQAVLLLLGGCELPPGLHEMEAASQSQKALEFPGRSSTPQRVASLNRFRQKRKERCFDKKVRYSVRQEVALRMQRNKGQFTSSKKPDNWVEEIPQETLCSHCGIDSKNTPMMRRGPSGPRSLCNACGLFWANRGTLRDLSKKALDNPSSHDHVEVETNDSDSGAVIASDNDLVGYSNVSDTLLIADNDASRLSPPRNGYGGLHD